MTRSTFCKNVDKKSIRGKIDLLDCRIVALLEKRMSYVYQLKNLKKTMTDKKREEEILAKIANPFIQEIYRSIFKCSKKMLKKLQD
jgi:chorismate mutase